MPTRELVSRDLRRMPLGGESLEYLLVRRRGRRGVGLRVDEGGLTVSAPASLPLAKIEAVVRESERWVLGKLREWSGRQVPAMSWAQGAALPYLGTPLTLRIAEAARGRVERVGEWLWAHMPPGAGGDRLRRAVVDWYRLEARAYLGGRIEALSAAAGIAPPRLIISGALSRWGSCNTRREVRLAWRLLKAPAPLVDYVVCHELAHLRHMDHSSAFWAEVERQCPDYRARRRELFATDFLYRSF